MTTIPHHSDGEDLPANEWNALVDKLQAGTDDINVQDVAARDITARNITATLGTFKGPVLDVHAFGARDDNLPGSAAANDAAFEAANAAAKVGSTIYFPAYDTGIYQISAPLRLKSGVRYLADSWGTKILGTQLGQPLAASDSWLDSSKSVTGRLILENMNFAGQGSTAVGVSAANHGVVIRDYYSVIRNLQVNGVGGDALRFDSHSQDDTVIGGTLVENHLDRIRLSDMAGYGLYYGRSDVKLTDASIRDVKVSCTATSPVGVYVGSAAGTSLTDIHTYGQAPTVAAIQAQGPYYFRLQDVYIEKLGLQYGIYLQGAQTGTTIKAAHIRTTSALGGEACIFMSKSGGYANCWADVDGLMIEHNGLQAVTAIKNNSSVAYYRVRGLSKFGSGVAFVTDYSVTDTAALSFVKDALLTGRLQEASDHGTLQYAGQEVPYTQGVLVDPATSQAQLAITGLGTYRRIHGILTLHTAVNYNGATRAKWVAIVEIYSRDNAADSWTVYSQDLVAANGFAVAPALAVNHALGSNDGTLTVTWDDASVDGYGALTFIQTR